MDLSFVVPVAHEGKAQLDACLSNIRTHYPDAPVAVVSDGVHDPHYAELAKNYTCQYIEGVFLKRYEANGLWWKRLLTVGLAQNTRYVVKMDPDARIHRQFKQPEHDFGLFGTLGTLGNTSKHNIQGGIQFFTRNAVERLLKPDGVDSINLIDQKLYCYGDDHMLLDWISIGFMGSDLTMMNTVKKLGITYGNWDEIHSIWRGDVTPQTLTHAATHPHKMPNPNHGTNETIHLLSTCKGRLDNLKEALPTWKANNNVTITVLDADCPNGTQQWLREHHPDVNCHKIHDYPVFQMSHAKNVVSQYAPKGWWLFIDSDIKLTPDACDQYRKIAAKGVYATFKPPQKYGLTGSFLVHSDDFEKTNGFSTLYHGWGVEDIDMYFRLRCAGVHSKNLPSGFATVIPHGDELRVEFQIHKNKEKQHNINKAIFRKEAWKEWKRLHTEMSLHPAVGIPQ